MPQVYCFGETYYFETFPDIVRIANENGIELFQLKDASGALINSYIFRHYCLDNITIVPVDVCECKSCNGYISFCNCKLCKVFYVDYKKVQRKSRGKKKREFTDISVKSLNTCIHYKTIDNENEILLKIIFRGEDVDVRIKNGLYSFKAPVQKEKVRR